MGTENGDKLGGDIGRCGGIGEQCEKPLESTGREPYLIIFGHAATLLYVGESLPSARQKIQTK
jgi:hypothetical protein